MMKTKILRTMCIGLALAAGCWSCTKERSSVDPAIRSENVIAEARAFYESTARPLTKTVADREVAIKPLPGEMTPLWDQAMAVAASDGTSWVDVPIEAAISYTAVRGGFHDHSPKETCGHDHSSVQTVQKLSVYTAAEGGRQAWIATIVPEPDCTADPVGFSSATGLAEFCGFVSWHDLTGRLIRVTRYEHGVRTASVDATEDNGQEIGIIVGNTILLPLETDHSVVTKAGSGDKCSICKQECKAKNDNSKHCMMCKQYDYYADPFNSKCACLRCSMCGLRIKPLNGMTVTCTCGNTFTPAVCQICGLIVCNHLLDGGSADTPPVIRDPVTAHSDMFDKCFGARYPSDQIRMMKLADQMLDRDYQHAGEEYIHGMYTVDYSTTTQRAARAEARTKMRNHFIRYVRGFVFSRDLSSLAEGLHPVLDTYVEMQTKVDLLNHYSYTSPLNIVHGMHTSPYTVNPTPCLDALEYIYTELLQMNASTPESSLGTLFDAWEKKAQGNTVLHPDPLL